MAHNAGLGVDSGWGYVNFYIKANIIGTILCNALDCVYPLSTSQDKHNIWFVSNISFVCECTIL